jgi:hypothetical protein
MYSYIYLWIKLQFVYFYMGLKLWFVTLSDEHRVMVLKKEVLGEYLDLTREEING